MLKFLRRLSKKEAISLEDCLAQNGLPFDNKEAAKFFFYTKRDEDLLKIKSVGIKYPELDLDFKARSLKRLEDFYFACYVDKTIETNIPKEQLEELLTQYMRQVFVTNEIADWNVSENDFAEGRYELGLHFHYGPWGAEEFAHDLDKYPDNKERNRLYKKFMMYVPKEEEDKVQ